MAFNGRLQLRNLLAGLPLGQLRNLFRGRLAFHQRQQHVLPRSSEHVTEHAADLDVGFLQHFLHSIPLHRSMRISCLRRRVRSRNSRIPREGM